MWLSPPKQWLCELLLLWKKLQSLQVSNYELDSDLCVCIDDGLGYFAFTTRNMCTICESKAGESCDGASAGGDTWTWAHSPRCVAALSYGPGARLEKEKRQERKKRDTENNEERKENKSPLPNHLVCSRGGQLLDWISLACTLEGSRVEMVLM